MTRPLAARQAVVTGASRGIGRAVATALADAGARVILVARDAGRLAEVAGSLGRDAVAVACDLGVRTDVEATIERIRAITSAPDILVSNAGTFAIGRVGDLPPADVEQMLHLNLVAPYQLFHAFVPAMRARGSGNVVTIGSSADRASFPENAGYAASKFGGRGMHQVLREELRGSGVRTTLVSPAPVDTHLWDAIRPEAREGFPARDAMLRPDDVADAVLWAVTRPSHVNIDELRLSRA